MKLYETAAPRAWGRDRGEGGGGGLLSLPYEWHRPVFLCGTTASAA